MPGRRSPHDHGNVTTPTIVHGDAGNDHLHGGGGAAVLIGGRTTIDHNQDAALTSAATLWNDAVASYAARAAAVDAFLTVIDDGNADNLTGSAGNDLFYAGLADIPTDQKSGELDASALMAMIAASAAEGGTPAPTVDWTANSWGVAPLATPRPAANTWTADFLVLATQA